MTEILRSRPRTRRITEQAASWYLDLAEGLTPARHAQLLAWLRKSPAHREEFQAIADLHGDLAASLLACEEAAASLVAAARVARPERASRQPHGRIRGDRGRLMRRVGGGLAALFLLAIGVAGYRPALPAGRGYATADHVGHWRLADGSEIQLDHDSAISVRFTAEQREIDLLRGSAVIDVGHDPARPLLVRWAGAELRDVGTVFALQSTPGRVGVSVLSGELELRQAAATGLHGWLRQGPPATTAATHLHGGEAVTIDAWGRPLTAVSRADVAAATAWLPQRIRFQRESVAEVARRFNAYTEQPLRIEDADLAAQRISGVFDARDSRAFIAYLRSQPGIRISTEAGSIRVYRQRSPTTGAL